jgi:hypothetical protein
MIRSISFCLICLFFSLIATAQSTKKDFKQLLKLFEGRYKSTLLEGSPTEKQLLEQMTITIKRVKGSYLGKNTFYVKYVRGNGSLYRQRLYTFNFDGQKIQSESVGFVSDSLFTDFHTSKEKIKNLTKNDLKILINCADTWQKVGNEFVGSMDNCPFKSERRGGKEIFISSKMKVSKKGLATTEAGKDETGKLLFGKTEDYALILNRF